MRSTLKRQWIFLLAILVMASPAKAEAPDASTLLDGRVFVGKIGAKGAPDIADELHFRDGQFWSERCIQCGFQPGPYKARKVGETIHVRGQLSGHGGTFDYEGTIVGDVAQMNIKWIKKRWYWTIERDMEFSGALQPGVQALAVKDAYSTAVSVTEEQRALCGQ